ncbi:nucleotide pyrophosphohydrolase [Candidatus Peregrinibacteria bacterium]|nr:nucleotide pyrophosphohydrolase [Candidatus Peregrinibacteria bacterium]
MKKKTFEDLCRLAEKLRSDTGCPWDRTQTVSSMLECVDEEADEVCGAIKKEDYENLEEELGDLLFQIIMISQIAKENGHFNIDGVIAAIENKIISRHTWVFGKDKAETPDEAIAMWKENKRILAEQKSKNGRKK